MKRLSAMPLAFMMLAAPAYSNDGYGGISSSGLLFKKTDAISMVKEDLYISPETIRVDYVFQNNTDQDVSGEVIFPLPLFSPINTYHSPSPIAQDISNDNPYQFTANIDGKPVPVSLDIVALLVDTPPYDPETDTPESVVDPLNDWAQVDFLPPGINITETLKQYDIPLTLNMVESSEKIATLPAEVIEKFLADEWIFIEGEGEDQVIMPRWELAMRYHWSQTFPAQAALKVSHSYNTNPGSMLLMDTATLKHNPDFIDQYCVNETEFTQVADVMKIADPAGFAFGNDVDYILRSANSWAGPIHDFRLTVDYLDPKNAVVFCAEDKVQASPTTIVIERKDYLPSQDMKIMFVLPSTTDDE